jgi:hypothetical protein
MNTKQPNKYLSAYKLYIKEVAKKGEFSKKIFWDENSHGFFSLTAKNINLLINNAINYRHEFPNKRILRGKDHGKGLEKNFENIKQGSNIDQLNDFCTLFKAKSFDEFKADDALSETFLQAVDIYKQQDFTNPDYYIFYYWDKKAIGKAIIEVESKDKLWERSQINYFHFSESESKWISLDADETQVEKPVSEKTKLIGNNLHVYIRTSNPTFLIIHSSDGNFRKNAFFCNYCTTYLGHSFSGVGILEKIQASGKIQAINRPVSPQVFNSLFQRRSFLNAPEEAYSPSPGDMNFSFHRDLAETADQYKGVYKGYYLDKDFDDKATAIRTLLLEIKNNGEILVNDGEASGPFSGFWSIAAEKQVMYITCDFQFQVGDIPRFQITIDIPQEPSEKLEGVYGGYSKKNQPYIGQIVLKKIPRLKSIFEAAVKKYAPQNFKKGNQAGKIFDQAISEDIVKYFMDAKFYNAPGLCIDERILNKFTSSGDKEYNGPSGIYYIYSSSSLKKGIVRYPVLIERNGTVLIKAKDDVIEMGNAFTYFRDDFLVLNFYKPDKLAGNRPSKGVFVFSTAHKEIKATIAGISLRVNDEDKAQAKRELLVPIQVGIGSSRTKKNHKEVFDHLKFEIIAPAKNNDVEEDLMNVLLGREYNLIIVSRDIKRREKIIQRHDFKRMYLFEALFEFQKNGLMQNKHVRYSLKQAIEHGLLTWDKFKEHIEEYCSVTQTKMVFGEILNKIKPVFNGLLEDYHRV